MHSPQELLRSVARLLVVHRIWGPLSLASLTALTCTPSARVQTHQEAVEAYERGDYATAIRGFRVSAEQGNRSAQFNLGVMYDNGWGVPQNDAVAVKWYRLAAEQGFADAQFNLGNMYNDGRGVPQNDAVAVKWYRLAAEQGFADAQLNLGVMYAKGEGVPEDYVRAYAWLNLAASQGDKQSIKAKDLVRSKMSRDQIARSQELSATLFERINQSR